MIGVKGPRENRVLYSQSKCLIDRKFDPTRKKKLRKTGLPLQPTKFGDQSTLRAVDFRLEERTTREFSHAGRRSATAGMNVRHNVH